MIINNPESNLFTRDLNGQIYRSLYVEEAGWNMLANQQYNFVFYDIKDTDWVIGFTGYILNDAGDTIHAIPYYDTTINDIACSVYNTGSRVIGCYRKAGSIFENAAYSSAIVTRLVGLVFYISQA